MIRRQCKFASIVYGALAPDRRMFLAIALSAFLGTAASPARAQQVPQWSADLTAQRAPVTNGGHDDTWATDGIQARWVEPGKAGWLVTIQRERRYDLVDNTIYTEGYVRADKWTLLAGAGGTPDAAYMYRMTAGGEISRIIVKSTVGSVGYRYFQFPGAHVQQLQPAFTWYHAAGEIQGRLFVTRNMTLDRTTATGLVRALHDINTRLRIGGGFAYGDRIFDVAALAAPSGRAHQAYGNVRIRLTGHDFVQVGVSLAHEEPAFTYRSLLLGYRRSF
jgi:YaiO family outer membrane protein